MGIDTTPGPDDQEPEGSDFVPGWLLLLIVVIVTAGGLWFLLVFLNTSRPL